MGISRQAAQRLVSLAVSERLVRVWMEHPIARCLDLAARPAASGSASSGPRWCRATPSDDGGTVGLGEAGAAEMARWLRREQPIVMAVGTGRTLKAAIDHLPPIDCPQHRVVSLTGNIGPDGVGGLLQRDLLHGRGGGGPALPDAAAGLRRLARRSGR